MPSRKVKCPVCGQLFQREETEYVQFKQRYYHKECYETLSKNEVIKEQIHTLMREVLGDEYNKARISQQINQFGKEGISVNDIYKTLTYWYKVQGSSPQKANGGIGIVPFVVGQALDYYDKKEKRKELNKQVNHEEPEAVTVVVHPKPISKPRRLRLFPMKE